MFLHQGLDHPFANMQTILFFGKDVHQEIGSVGLYGLFLVAGVAAGANKRGRAAMTESQLHGSIPRVPDSIGPVSVPEGAIAAWDWSRQKLAHYTAPIVQERIEAFGASGAACGLMGYSFMTALSRFLHMYAGTHLDQNLFSQHNSANNLDLALSLASVAQCSHFFFNEWRL